MPIYPEMTKANTALLVIDPINSCAHEQCETPEQHIHFTKIRKMLPKLNAFIKKYRHQIGGLIVFTTITPWNKDYLPKNLNRLYTDPEATYYSDDNTGFDEKFHTVDEKDSDSISVKNTYDAFTDRALIEKFRQRHIQYIVVTGIFSDGCVLASIVSGFSKGYNFVILKDLIETTDSPTRQQLQKLLIQFTFPKMYGKTILSKELLRAM